MPQFYSGLLFGLLFSAALNEPVRVYRSEEVPTFETTISLEKPKNNEPSVERVNQQRAAKSASPSGSTLKVVDDETRDHDDDVRDMVASSAQGA